MSKNAWISTGIFFVLLVLVVATREDRVRVGVRELPYKPVKAADVTEIEIGGKTKARLTRDGDAWLVAAPDAPDARFPAEKAQVDRALEALELLEGGPFVTGRREKHDELEVSDEKGTALSVKTKDGATLRLVLGRFAKGGGNYMRYPESSEVYVGKGNLASQIKKDVDAWRDKKILDVPADAAASLVVERAGADPYTILHEKTGEGESKTDVWKLADGTPLPSGFRVDAESLGRQVRALTSLRAAGFVDDKAKLASLTTTAGKLTLTLDGGEKKTLLFGDVDEEKKVPVKIEGGAQVYLVTEYTMKNLMKAVDEHRDLALFPGVDSGVVNEVRFSSVAGAASVKRAGESFVYSGPSADVVDEEGIAGKLQGLVRLKATKLLGDEATVKAKLTEPLEITLVLADGTTRTARMGGEVPGVDGKPSNTVYATIGDGQVYEIGKFQKTRHEKPHELFKRVERPPPGAGGGGMQGLESLPPEIRKQLEAQLKAQGR